MLEAGGLDVIVGPARKDEDNPHGYYESRRVSKLGEDTTADREFVRANGGRVLKVLSHMLRKLPDGLPYRTIFMLRDSAEIRQSIEKMNARRMKRPVRPVKPGLSVPVLRSQESARMWLTRRSPEHLVVQYRELVDDPVATSHDLAEFMGLEDKVDEMIACVDRSLYRNRS
jgi:hypothetical protein